MSSIIRVIIHNITRMLHLESIYSTKARILNHGFHGAPARPRPRDTWTCGLVKVNTVLLCDAGLAARLDGSEDAAHLLVHRRYIINRWTSAAAAIVSLSGASAWTPGVVVATASMKIGLLPPSLTVLGTRRIC